jgi:putative membrane protein
MGDKKEELLTPLTASALQSHMANERTFLAWVRTSIGLMAFGFVVERFTIFMRQATLLLEAAHAPSIQLQTHFKGYMSFFGAILVALGIALCLLAFAHYRSVGKQIDDNRYKPSILPATLLTITVVLIGIFLASYLEINL